MSTLPVTRRAAFAAFGAIALAPGLALRRAFAQGGVRFREVRVDVSPLRANVGDPTAAWVQEALPGALAQVLAAYMSPGDRYGATLTARIDHLYLGPRNGTGTLGSSQDTIEGVLFVHGPRGSAAAATPLTAISSYYSNPFDQPLWVESNHIRVTALAQAFAGWVPRELGL
jgi:hypothetical protein